MKWRKLGLIFNPYNHNLPFGCFGYAQAPQVLIRENSIRIYFSLRKVDQNNKFLSHIAFIDMDESLTNITVLSQHTVLELGKLGCFDQHGIFPLNVLHHGNRIIGYTSGIHRKQSVPIDTAIGFVESFDGGDTFQRVGLGPILSATLHEPCIIGDPFVKVINGQFHMWYIFSPEWLPASRKNMAPERVYKIAYAYSDDGITWQRSGRPIIPDKINKYECQALPSLVFFNHRFHLFFCYRHATDFRTNPSCSYRIGYAYSDDLEHWYRDDENVGIDVSKTGWDSNMQCYPHVFVNDGNVYMLYNGNDFGREGFGLAVLEQI
ncbi:hypothetical protein [Zooshikella ganghwensis]|uniref:Glycosylase n=1 Tax=Zooshikella ganghwensis TaxID=202772 RepID=A0A4P9VMF5_9GAMM|nr:hypothetical protein [Zooshikella ganghwensis]RDH44066.1 hypothetical protein B9G39_11745 [Zooshikella ganghwensis]